jgi:glyoxylase-like metal-dependent hydrolase (beta-lactamase superfamily II)
MRIMSTVLIVASGACVLTAPSAAQEPRALLEQAAVAMGGRARLEALDNFVMTGFGMSISQQGGGNLSPDPRAPSKWQAANAVERRVDLRNGRASTESWQTPMFPFAISRTGVSQQVQTARGVLDHPVTALLAAIEPDSTLGPVRTEDNLLVVEFTTRTDDTLWLAIDPNTHLPSWVRWIAPSTTLGDVTTTTYFTGYLPFEEIWLPVGITTGIDWRDTTTSVFHVDAYRLDVDDFEPIPPRTGTGGPSDVSAEATPIADGVWDVRYATNGGAVIEFDDHLMMFEAYANEAATFARIDLANTLVPGKEVTEVIVSHHHFDHSGGLRAAVSRGLTIIAQRGNEQIFREMVARPAPNFPDALARHPQPLKFVPVDEHLVIEDETARVDVYHAVGHLHMANAVVGYIPEHRIFLEGDFTTHDWDWHWWGDAYLDTVERYDLEPVLNIPVHGIVTTFEEAIEAIEAQVSRARQYCEETMAAGFYFAGCPVKYSR